MTLSRTVRRTVLTAALLSASALTVSSSAVAEPAARAAAPAAAQAAPLPPACQEALLETLDKFPVVDFTVPDKAKNALLAEVLGLSEADQAAFTEAGCAAWNTWATDNGQAVATDLDTRYRNAAAPACNKFAKASIGSIKKFAPNVPAATLCRGRRGSGRARRADPDRHVAHAGPDRHEASRAPSTMPPIRPTALTTMAITARRSCRTVWATMARIRATTPKTIGTKTSEITPSTIAMMLSTLPVAAGRGAPWGCWPVWWLPYCVVMTHSSVIGLRPGPVMTGLNLGCPELPYEHLDLSPVQAAATRSWGRRAVAGRVGCHGRRARGQGGDKSTISG
ncbi:hypothetical protein [Streptomyces sp. NPDC088727]|uniref:hypothetical protein n=1 Tax=Streptomyces sp. NPDC088727 TaxID=3365875 RepID=UPI0037FD2C2D